MSEFRIRAHGLILNKIWEIVLVEQAPHLQHVFYTALSGFEKDEVWGEAWIELPWLYYIISWSTSPTKYGMTYPQFQGLYCSPKKIENNREWLSRLPIPNLDEGYRPCLGISPLDGAFTSLQMIHHSIHHWWSADFNLDYITYQHTNPMLGDVCGKPEVEDPEELFTYWECLNAEDVLKCHYEDYRPVSDVMKSVGFTSDTLCDTVLE